MLKAMRRYFLCRELTILTYLKKMRHIPDDISECPFFFVYTIKPTKLGDAAKQDHQALCHVGHQLGSCGQVVQNIVPCRDVKLSYYT